MSTYNVQIRRLLRSGGRAEQARRRAGNDVSEIKLEGAIHQTDQEKVLLQRVATQEDEREVRRTCSAAQVTASGVPVLQIGRELPQPAPTAVSPACTRRDALPPRMDHIALTSLRRLRTASLLFDGS